jgi:hypothetical protein
MQNHSAKANVRYTRTFLATVAVVAIVGTIFSTTALAGGTGADGYKCDTQPQTGNISSQTGLVPEGLLIPCA